MTAPVAGRVDTLWPGVRRLVAPNAGPFTGPGTNTYLLGTDTTWVLDPGPDDPVHLAAIRAAAPQIAGVLLTHTHRDHSPAAWHLRRDLGVPVLGRSPRLPDRQDDGGLPDRELGDGESLELGGVMLDVIATPGHASNHLCFGLRALECAFTGDHVLGWVSPVIVAPDGDLAQYLASLERLARWQPRVLAPGHGPLLEQPAKIIAALHAHRLQREQLVLAALDSTPRPIGVLVPRVYADVPVDRHELARHTLLAHLLKLEAEGRVRESAAGWATT